MPPDLLKFLPKSYAIQDYLRHWFHAAAQSFHRFLFKKLSEIFWFKTLFTFLNKLKEWKQKNGKSPPNYTARERLIIIMIIQLLDLTKVPSLRELSNDQRFGSPLKCINTVVRRWSLTKFRADDTWKNPKFPLEFNSKVSIKTSTHREISKAESATREPRWFQLSRHESAFPWLASSSATAKDRNSSSQQKTSPEWILPDREREKNESKRR